MDSGTTTPAEQQTIWVHVLATAIVVVHFAPEFVVKPPSALTVHIGETVKISCSVKGDPQPVVTWRRESGRLPMGRSENTVGQLVYKESRSKGLWEIYLVWYEPYTTQGSYSGR